MSVPYPLTCSGLDGRVKLPVGHSATWSFTIQQAYGTAVTGVFTGSDTIAATVWPGDDQAQTFAPTCAWVSATNGTATLTIAGSSTTSLTPGTYRLQISVTQSGSKYLVHEGVLVLSASPGSGTALTTYCSFQDMQRLYSQIGDLHDAGTDQTGFAEQRHEARTWLEDIIQRSFKTSVAVSQTFFTYWDGGLYRSGRHNDWLKGQLDNDHLLVTDAVKKVCACYAIGEVLGAQTGRNTDNIYLQHSTKFKVRASSLASLLTVELDTNSDGVGDYAISLGVVDVMRG